MTLKNLSQRLSILSVITFLTGCAVYANPNSTIDGVYSSSVITTPIPVNNGVTYSTEIFPYSNGIIYTNPAPIYFNYYPSRPYPYYRPYYPHPRPPRPHMGPHPGGAKPDIRPPLPPKGNNGNNNGKRDWENRR